MLESLKGSFPMAGTILEAKNLPGSSPEKAVVFNELPLPSDMNNCNQESMNVSMVEEKMSVNTIPDLKCFKSAEFKCSLTKLNCKSEVICETVKH
jgi:hypothetical protein